MLTMEYETSQETPKGFKITKDIQIKCNIVYQCEQNLTVVMKWYLWKTDINGIIIKNIDISSNPTSSTPSLFLSNGFLGIGFYTLTFRTIVSYDKGRFDDNQTIHISVEPPDFVVNGLQYGNTILRIGKKDSVLLDAFTYSFIANHEPIPNNQIFTFDCRMIDLNKYQTDMFNANVNTSGSSSANRSKCFSSRGKIEKAFF